MKILLVAIIGLFTAFCSHNDTHKFKEVKRYDAKTFYKTITHFDAGFSHDESKILVSSDQSGIFNAYAFPVDGAKPKQLTRSKKDTIRAISYFPNDDRILYTSDKGGNEISHLYVRSKNGKIRDLTPGKKNKAQFGGWSKNKKHFYVISNGRDPKYFDVYRYNTSNYRRTRIFKNTLGVMPGVLSRDERWLTLNKTNNNLDSDIYLMDLKTPKAKPILISTHKTPAKETPLTFTPDSKNLIYTTNLKSEFAEGWQYNLETKAKSIYRKTDWDIWYMYFSENGRYRVTGINKDAKTSIEVFDTTVNKVVKMPEFSGSVKSVRFSWSEKKILAAVESDTAPADLFVMSTTDLTPVPLTKSLNPEIASTDLVESTVVRYKSFDGLKIPAILYRPHQSNAENKVPAIVWVHGGPGGQSRVRYSPMIQHLVNHGYAVLAVNNRGSTGYGKTFFHADDKKHGDVDLKDCIWGRKYLESMNWVDDKKVAIMGGSYGGYMVAAALAFTPDAFELGINIFGVTNWLRTLKSIPPWWGRLTKTIFTLKLAIRSKKRLPCVQSLPYFTQKTSQNL